MQGDQIIFLVGCGRSDTMASSETENHGSCHCKAIQFRFYTSPPTKVSLCNCSICTMKGSAAQVPCSLPTTLTFSGFQHLVVPKDKFTLLTPWGEVKTYTFGTGIAKHYFCGTCGVSPFYVPRSNPNGYSVIDLGDAWISNCR